MKKALLLIIVTLFTQLSASSKDSFVIEIKQKGSGSLTNLIPEKSLLRLFKENPSVYEWDPEQVEKIESLDYENLTFNKPLTLPNSLIDAGYKFAFVYVQSKDYLDGEFFSTPNTIKLKPNHHYTLTIPLDTGKTKEERYPSGLIQTEQIYICPNGKEGTTFYKYEFCVSESPIQ